MSSEAAVGGMVFLDGNGCAPGGLADGSSDLSPVSGLDEVPGRSPYAEPSTPRVLAEFSLWALSAACFACLAWLCMAHGPRFGAARNWYVLMAAAGLGVSLVAPLLLPWRSTIPWRLLGGIGLVSFGADQVSKWLAVCFLKGRASIPVVHDLFSLTYLENSGAAFGMFQGRTTLFIAMALVTLGIIVLYFRWTGPEERMVQVALFFILAGAVGNLVDRVFLGYVVDFLDLHHGSFRWPVFNIADTTIDIGVGLIILDVLRDVIYGGTEPMEDCGDAGTSACGRMDCAEDAGKTESPEDSGAAEGAAGSR